MSAVALALWEILSERLFDSQETVLAGLGSRSAHVDVRPEQKPYSVGARRRRPARSPMLLVALRGVLPSAGIHPPSSRNGHDEDETDERPQGQRHSEPIERYAPNGHQYEPCPGERGKLGSEVDRSILRRRSRPPVDTRINLPMLIALTVPTAGVVQGDRISKPTQRRFHERVVATLSTGRGEVGQEERWGHDHHDQLRSVGQASDDAVLVNISAKALHVGPVRTDAAPTEATSESTLIYMRSRVQERQPTEEHPNDTASGPYGDGDCRNSALHGAQRDCGGSRDRAPADQADKKSRSCDEAPTDHRAHRTRCAPARLSIDTSTSLPT